MIGEGKVPEISDVPTAEFLLQAKHAKEDYHGAMTNKTFTDCIKMRVIPAFKPLFDEDKKRF